MWQELKQLFYKWFVYEERVRGFEVVSNIPSGKLVIVPNRTTKGSACYDFYLPEAVRIPAMSYSRVIPTYIKAYMPEGEVLLLHIRSSVGIKKHTILANCTGVIDSDYYNNPDNEGNIGLVLYNYGDEAVTFKQGERIMQGMFTCYGVADDDCCTEERMGGTGSTGK